MGLKKLKHMRWKAGKLAMNHRQSQFWEDGTTRYTSSCPDCQTTYWSHPRPHTICDCGSWCVVTEEAPDTQGEQA